MKQKIGDFLSFDRNKILGRHGNFRTVFKGIFKKDSKEQDVAIKRYVIDTIDLLTKDEYLMKVSHPNIANLLHITTDEDFRYVAMELGMASLDCLFLRNDKHRKYNGPMPSNQQVLLQLSNGLGYLHSLKIMHGDIKPENILISSTTPVQMKWTDFGLRRSRKDSCSLSQSATRMGSRMWWAPEMYNDEKEITEKGEVFSTGCVFLYFLSDGCHPFAFSGHGEPKIAKNVIEGNIIHRIDLSKDKLDFVWEMIKTNPDDRIPLHEVIGNLEILQRPNSIIRFQSLQYDEKSYLNGQYSCGLCVLESEGMVVKRIPIDCCSQKPFEELNKLNHSNVVRILHFNEQEPYRYFGMEFCAVSLDHFFLPVGDPKKYKGPMPSHEQVFFQIVTGLQFIHENNLVHGSIKPSNILISSSQDPQIKLAEFGLTLPRWDNSNSSTILMGTGFQSDHYWMAPELLKVIEAVKLNGPTILNPTKLSDVFAAGKVFFYYYNLFYADELISNRMPPNSSTETQGNVFEKLPAMETDFPMRLITNMTKEDPESRLSLLAVIDRIKLLTLTSRTKLKPLEGNTSQNCQFSRNHILGEGAFGKVHLGLWGNSIVAIKRIGIHGHRRATLISREEELKKLEHRNIVRFFGSEKDIDFTYIAMEKCLVSLKAYCRHQQLYHGVIPMPSSQQVLLQIAEGLQYIHSKNLIHRDVKPANILISADNPAVIKWTDFGLSKEDKKNNSTTWTSRQGSVGWMAPEVDQDIVLQAGKESDIFSLGCVFFFFLTPAIHPFGDNPNARRDNIKSLEKGNKPQNIAKLPAKHHFALAVIEEMIEYDPERRPLISKVINDLNTLLVMNLVPTPNEI